VVQCWVNTGSGTDEEMQLIPWTEQPTGALVAAGSLWPILGNHNQFLTPVLIPKIRPGFHAVLGNQNQTDSSNQFLGWLELSLQQSFFFHFHSPKSLTTLLPQNSNCNSILRLQSCKET